MKKHVTAGEKESEINSLKVKVVVLEIIVVTQINVVAQQIILVN